MSGYDYKIEQTMKAVKAISVADLNAVPDTMSTVEADFKQNFLAQFASKLHSQHGISVVSSSIEHLVVSLEEKEAGQLYFRIDIKFSIKTNVPCHKFGSPVAWWIKDLAVLGVKVIIICVGIYVVVWAIERITEALKSLTTTTSISWIHDDNEGSPNYCEWHEIRTEEPNIFGSAMIIVLLLVIAFIAFLGFGGLRKKQ